jgi:hypothetical protein
MKSLLEQLKEIFDSQGKEAALRWIWSLSVEDVIKLNQQIDVALKEKFGDNLPDSIFGISLQFLDPETRRMNNYKHN